MMQQQTIAISAITDILPQDGKKRRTALGLAMTILALISAVASFIVLIGVTPVAPSRHVTSALTFVNVVMVVVLIVLIMGELSPLIRAWRAGRAASRLHVRIITLFSIVAAFPALIVAVVAAVTLNLGLDRWFDVNTRQIVGSSASLANAYASATLQSLQAATYAMSLQLDNRILLSFNETEYRRQLTLHAAGRDLRGVFLLREDGSVIVSSQRGGEASLPIPPQEWIKGATQDKPARFQPGMHDYFGVAIKLRNIDDAWLYVVRDIEPRVLSALRLVDDNADHYRELETNRYPIQIAFAVLYFCLFLIMLLSAIWTAMAVADRLVRPIRRLINAADQVASGNMEVAVPVLSRDGDVGHLSKTFNNMVTELKAQRNELIGVRDQIDERRRFTEAVLSGVTAAVIGVDKEGVITMINRSAEMMFGFDSSRVVGQHLPHVTGEIGKVFETAAQMAKKNHREQVTVTSSGLNHVYNVQITMEEKRSDNRSFVVTIDDITDLVEAQRSAAWADVARRIAHEIKNPLTPIQLSAERIRRRYGKMIKTDREVFDQCTETIIRQVGDIGRMVDEFSSFARMPKPALQAFDVRIPLKEACFLTEVSHRDIQFDRQLGDVAMMGAFDCRLIGQAFANVIKNASEAIEAARIKEGRQGHILVKAWSQNDMIIVDIIDNGKGLPKEGRQRLLEPYMTTREKGTGLGLAIVRKIVEEHGGMVELHDAPLDFHGGVGAMIRMIFPMVIDKN